MGKPVYVIKSAGPGLINLFYAGRGQFTDTPAFDGIKTFRTRGEAVKTATRLSNKGLAVRVVYYPQGV